MKLCRQKVPWKRQLNTWKPDNVTIFAVAVVVVAASCCDSLNVDISGTRHDIEKRSTVSMCFYIEK